MRQLLTVISFDFAGSEGQLTSESPLSNSLNLSGSTVGEARPGSNRDGDDVFVGDG